MGRKKVATQFTFLINITLHMNELNLTFQGKGKLVYGLDGELHEFMLN